MSIDIILIKTMLDITVIYMESLKNSSSMS